MRCLSAVKAALREDAAGCGMWVDASLAARLNRIRKNGQFLPGSLARAMEKEFGCDLSRIRVHAGDGVDEVAATFRAPAFCVGTDVFLGRPVLHAADRSLFLAVLRHELAHIVHRTEPERIRFWDAIDHFKLTLRACEAFTKEFDVLVTMENIGITKKDLFRGLKISSSNMDLRKRFRHPLDTLSYVFGHYLHFTKVPIVSVLFTEGEGPRHGEGANYTVAEEEPNRRKNLEKEDEEIADAADNFETDKGDSWDEALKNALPGLFAPQYEEYDPKTWDGKKIGGSAINIKDWIKNLANALHVAQDRASHREGMKHFGHDDPREGFNPDDRTKHDHRGHNGKGGRSWYCCSAAAYNKALNNSYKVLGKFFKKIGIKLLHTPSQEPETCMDHVHTPEIYFSPYPNPYTQAVAGRWAYPYGHCSGLLPGSGIPAAKALAFPENPPFGRWV